METKEIGASKGGGKETKCSTSYVQDSLLGLGVVTALRSPCSHHLFHPERLDAKRCSVWVRFRFQFRRGGAPDFSRDSSFKELDDSAWV